MIRPSENMLLGILILKFKYTPLERVDHMGILVLVIPLMLSAIRHVHMPMEKIFWPVFFDQFPKHRKSLMRQVPPVIELVCGRMGDQDVKPAFPKQLKLKFCHPSFPVSYTHLTLPTIGG